VVDFAKPKDFWLSSKAEVATFYGSLNAKSGLALIMNVKN